MRSVEKIRLLENEPVIMNEIRKFRVGDHVRWNSEAGYVSGRIIRIHVRNTLYKGHLHHASEAEPQYEIKSDATDHIAMHKGAVLRKLD